MSPRVLKAPEVILETDDSETLGRFQAATQEAFRQGFEAGAADATQGLEHQVAQLGDALSAAVEGHRGGIASAIGLDANAITELACDIAQWFMDGAVRGEPTVLVDSIQPALTRLADQTGVILNVHPDVVDHVHASALGVDAVRGDASLGLADFKLVADTSTLERRWRDAMPEVAADIAAAVAAAGTREQLNGE